MSSSKLTVFVRCRTEADTTIALGCLDERLDGLSHLSISYGLHPQIFGIRCTSPV